MIVSGDLIVVQKTNLPYKGTNDEFNAPLIDEATSVSGFDLNGLMESYTARNLSTVFVYNYNGWQEGKSAENDFKLKVSINYPKQQLRYEPGFLEEIKFAWMQYFRPIENFHLLESDLPNCPYACILSQLVLVNI